jgi:hypothetical protein
MTNKFTEPFSTNSRTHGYFFMMLSMSPRSVSMNTLKRLVN